MQYCRRRSSANVQLESNWEIQVNGGVGGGPQVVSGQRSANEVDTLQGSFMSSLWSLPALDAIIDATAFSAAEFGIL